MSKETTIGQLQEAEVLNDNDELVVAQEGQAMARKTNIAALAAKVGESIGGGASMDGEEAAALLTELQTKYAQGKLALAKALTNKGEATSAKEDIIRMADKVSNLPVDNGYQIYPGYIIYTTTQQTSISYVIKPLGSKYIAYYAASTVYICPKNVDNVTSIEEHIATAVSTKEVNGNITLAAYSGTGKWLGLYISATNTVVMYNIDTDTGAILSENSYTVDRAPYSSTTNNVLLDDGYTWCSTAGSGTSDSGIYFCDVRAGSLTLQRITNIAPSGIPYGTLYTVDDTIYMPKGNNATYNLSYTKVSYSEGTYSAQMKSIAVFPSGTIITGLCCIPEINKLAIFGAPSNTNINAADISDGVLHMKLSFFDCSNESLGSVEESIPVHYTGEAIAASSYEKAYINYGNGVFHGINNPITEYNADTNAVTIYSGIWPRGLTVNLSNMSLDNPSEEIYFSASISTSSSSNSGIAYAVSQGGTMLSLDRCSGTTRGNSSSNVYANTYVGSTKYIIKAKITKGTSEGYVQYPYSKNKADDLIPYSTVITPAVPDEVV